MILTGDSTLELIGTIVKITEEMKLEVIKYKRRD